MSAARSHAVKLTVIRRTAAGRFETLAVVVALVGVWLPWTWAWVVPVAVLLVVAQIVRRLRRVGEGTVRIEGTQLAIEAAGGHRLLHRDEIAGAWMEGDEAVLELARGDRVIVAPSPEGFLADLRADAGRLATGFAAPRLVEGVATVIGVAFALFAFGMVIVIVGSLFGLDGGRLTAGVSYDALVILALFYVQSVRETVVRVGVDGIAVDGGPRFVSHRELAAVRADESGLVVLTLSDGRSITLPRIKGASAAAVVRRIEEARQVKAEPDAADPVAVLRAIAHPDRRRALAGQMRFPVVVAPDGIVLRGYSGARCLVPFRAVTSFEAGARTITMRLSADRAVHLGPRQLDDAMTHMLAAALRAASQPEPPPWTRFGRAGRPIDTWRTETGLLLQREEGLRETPVRIEDARAALEARGTPAEHRIGAALGLAAAGTDADRDLVRLVAQRCAGEGLGRALRAAVDGDLDDADVARAVAEDEMAPAAYQALVRVGHARRPSVEAA